jgi:RNA polymerase sigma-70 factor (ECF subfamily)
MDHAQEIQVIRRAKQGDPTAFAELIESHQERLYRFLLRTTNQTELAEDAVQDAFIRVLKNIDRFDERYRFSTWLFTIARRLLLNSLQKKRPLNAGDWLDAASSSVMELSAESADSSDREFAAEILDGAMDSLTPHQREIVILYHHKGKSVHQIADLLGMPEGTIKSHLHRARRRMRDWMASSDSIMSRVEDIMIGAA